MKRLLLLVVAVPSVALSQGLTSSPPGVGQKRTNYALQSNTMDNASWLNFSTSATADAAPWVSIASAAAGGLRYQAITGMASSTKFVSSVYAKKASGTGYAGMRTQGPGTVSACTCSRSGPGTCSASFAGNECFIEVSDLGTAPERLVSVFTTATPGTGGQMGMIPGRWTVAVGTTLFYGAQIESLVTKASKLCVTTTAAKTCTN